MNHALLSKIVPFALIMTLGVAADQATKHYASARLAASRPGHFKHEVRLIVPPDLDGKTARDVLDRELTWSAPEELDHIASRYLRAEDDRPLRGPSEVKAGQTVRVTFRDVAIIKDHFDFQYTRNPGAAFSMLANADPELRRPFFLTIGVLAMLMILYILAGASANQRLLVYGLSFIASGAAGNLIDRVRYDYVIDFILWKYTDAYRFPTFNIADVLICVGVGLMALEMLRDLRQQRRESAAQDMAREV